MIENYNTNQKKFEKTKAGNIGGSFKNYNSFILTFKENKFLITVGIEEKTIIENAKQFKNPVLFV